MFKLYNVPVSSNIFLQTFYFGKFQPNFANIFLPVDQGHFLKSNFICRLGLNGTENLTLTYMHIMMYIL